MEKYLPGIAVGFIDLVAMNLLAKVTVKSVLRGGSVWNHQPQL